MKRVAYIPFVLVFLLLAPGAGEAQDLQTYIDQGIQHSQAGRYPQALQAFDQALKLKPKDPALITFKGIVYYAQGKNDQAMQLFEEALRLNPNFGRAYYQRGMIYQNQEKFDQALADLTKAKSLGYGIDPDFIELVKRQAASRR